MKLVIGLGNPGEKYRNNRHNVGYMVVDALERASLIDGLKAEKTQSFMNDSGDAVKKFKDFYKAETKNLYVVHDDLDIPLGQYKIQFGKGPKVHNGINDIELVLGTPEFWRIRVGVDNRDPNNREAGDKYVLQDFTEEETQTLKNVIADIIKDIAALK